MEKEIIYKRSRKDITMYLLLSIIGFLGSIYAFQVNSLVIGTIGLSIFGISNIYLIYRLICPNEILRVDKSGIKTKYTRGEYISWDKIDEIYIDMDSYKDRPVDVIAIKLKANENDKKNIRFTKPKTKVRGDYNVNLQYSDGNIEDALKEIREFYRNYIK